MENMYVVPAPEKIDFTKMTPEEEEEYWCRLDATLPDTAFGYDPAEV